MYENVLTASPIYTRAHAYTHASTCTCGPGEHGGVVPPRVRGPRCAHIDSDFDGLHTEHEKSKPRFEITRTRSSPLPPRRVRIHSDASQVLLDKVRSTHTQTHTHTHTHTHMSTHMSTHNHSLSISLSLTYTRTRTRTQTQLRSKAEISRLVHDDNLSTCKYLHHAYTYYTYPHMNTYLHRGLLLLTKRALLL